MTLKAPTDGLVGAALYPDQDQRKAGSDPDNQDDATEPVRHVTLRLLAPRLNFRAHFSRMALSQPREPENGAGWDSNPRTADSKSAALSLSYRPIQGCYTHKNNFR